MVLLLPMLRRRLSPWGCGLAVAGISLAYGVLHHLLALNPSCARWLDGLSSPLFLVFLTVILPALYLTEPRARQLFRGWPALLVLLAVLAVIRSYLAMPATDRSFRWFLAPAPYLIAGVVSLLVLIEPWLRVQPFRLVVKSVAFLVLIYGGFALRQDLGDYQDMQARRRDQAGGLMQLTETVPVIGGPRNMLHPPAAPCRFSADGGYVQGCNLELLQRLMQVDYAAVARCEVAQVGPLYPAVGSLLILLGLCFLSGRWFCGWVCPLHSLGTPLDWLRRRLGLPHLKLSRPVKLATFTGGLSLASLALLMARLYPSLDANGRFAGCKIPLYPFCKICPGQQLCPIAAGGPGLYTGLPNWDWGFGFFRVTLLAGLAFFALSFALGRRWWCRCCPMGMISGPFNRGATVALVKDAGKCHRCGVCAEVCPMDIELVLKEMQQREVGCFDCVYCLNCVTQCPRDGCLSFNYAGRKILGSRFERDYRLPATPSPETETP